jgi:hypothetical protein
MTEAEWLACKEPIAMIEYLRGSPVGEDRVSWARNSHEIHLPQRGHDRRFRLFSCLCCRRVWDAIPEAVNKAAVVAVEELLEGRMSPVDAWSALCASSTVEHTDAGRKEGYWIVKYLGRGFYKMTAGASSLIIANTTISMRDADYCLQGKNAFYCCYYDGVFLTPFEWPQPMPVAVQSECAHQVAILRDIFGNPFRPVSFDPAWRTDTAVSLARTMYDSREFGAMLILADALQDAGCEDEQVLNHCRDANQVHVRGCWVCDLVLGKN